MPGFNQRGPQGMGPMTGRGQGVCNNRNRQGTTDWPGYGAGGRGFGGGGRGRGMGRGFGPGPAAGPLPADQNAATLQERARMLEEELNALKAQLNTLSEDN